MPDPSKLLPMLRQAVLAFRQTPGRRGRFVELQNVDEVLVAGDLHGHVENFKKLLDLAQLAKHPRRHLVLQEVVHGPFRYPNGGDQSHRLLDLIAALKCQYPKQVHFLIGNHELSQWTGRAIMKNEEDLNDLFRRGIAAAYGSRSDEVYGCYEQLFEAAPVALRTPNRVFLSHSLPGANRMDAWDLAGLFREVHTEDDIKLGGVIHAVVWGKDLSHENALRYLQKVDADLLITGHIPCDDGFITPNPLQLILDCKDTKGRCCLFGTGRVMTQKELLAGMKRLNPEPVP